MKRIGVMFAALVVLVQGAASATTPPTALNAASASFAKIADYSMTIDVHEISGSNVQDRTYHVLFKKPLFERVDVIAGSGRGAGVVWLGGDKVKGHKGGFLSGLRLTMDLHNSQVVTLRGDGIETATIPSMLDDFTRIKGTVSQAPGPAIDGSDTVAVALDVADPASNNSVSREVLYLSTATHLPLRRERFAGATLVKSEYVTELKTDVGLTSNDFPW